MITPSDTVLRTKLQEPQTNIKLINRPRLLQSLDGCLDVPLTLISAPAGFGKTTLVSQWLEQVKQRGKTAPHTAWLSLDEHDDDVVTFLSHFIAALQTIYPDACPQTRQLLRTQALPVELNLLALLINEIDSLKDAHDGARARHLVIVLDDFDAMKNEAANHLLDMLVKFPPPYLHLILTCRRDPRLSLAQLHARRQLLEIRSRDLRLTHAEIQDFAQQFLPTHNNKQDVDLLETTSEGWFAILHLMSLVMRNQDGADAWALMPHEQQDIVTFLAEEVLARETPEMRDCLMRISLLDRFSAALCEELCEHPAGSGSEFLRRVRASNLFLLSLDNEGGWFRFHHLFRHILNNQLKQKYAREAQAALHLRAARWFRKHNLLEEAITHALAGDDISFAVGIVAEQRHALMNNEQWSRLEHWVNLFPPEAVNEYPDLLLSKAWLGHMYRNDLAFLNYALQQLQARLKRNDLPTEKQNELRAEGDVISAVPIALRDPGNPDALRFAERALRRLPRNYYFVRSLSWLGISWAYQAAGDTAQAYRVAQDALLEDNLPNEPARARAFAGICFTDWMVDDLVTLEERARQLLAFSQTSDMSETTGWAHYHLSCALYEKNDLNSAERHTRVLLDDSNYNVRIGPQIHAGFILASVQHAQNQPNKARQVLEQLGEMVLARRINAYHAILNAFKADLAARQGNLELAAHWLETQAPLLPPTSSMQLFYAYQLTAPRVLLALNTPASLAQAETVLADVSTYVRRIHNTHFLIRVLTMQALCYDAQGKHAAALNVLKQAVLTAEPGGSLRCFVDCSPRALPLLKELAAQKVAPTYLARVLGADATLKNKSLSSANDRLTELTEREYEVLVLLARRLTNKEIAQKLFISPLTVKVHTDHIYQKFSVNNRRDAVRAALSAGILTHADVI